MAGSERMIDLLANAGVTRRIYPGARHEIFNETNSDEVLARHRPLHRDGGRRERLT